MSGLNGQINKTIEEGSGGIESVTGSIVNNTDPLNPVVNLGYNRLLFNFRISGTDDPSEVVVSINEVGNIVSFTRLTEGAYSLVTSATTFGYTNVYVFPSTINSGVARIVDWIVSSQSTIFFTIRSSVTGLPIDTDAVYGICILVLP